MSLATRGGGKCLICASRAAEGRLSHVAVNVQRRQYSERSKPQDHHYTSILGERGNSRDGDLQIVRSHYKKLR